MALAGVASAGHSWGGYHWARTASPFTLKVIDANGAAWDGALDRAIADWNASSVMDVTEEAGAEDKRCRAVKGKLKSCNGKYGQNGWLGLAQIWLTGSHITQATAKMNDTYFAMAAYNSAVKRQHVMCQEIGHGFGLGHQDESGADLGTCMDYASALDNPSPNAHDYDQLVTIYGGHLDSTITLAQSAATQGATKPVKIERADGHGYTVIVEHYNDGSRRVTHVFWADDQRGKGRDRHVETD